ncbi:MAG TPA: AAA family ATPase, partial [Actinomycetota bacterium]|nr:AAA family ATPase [Actinomycetota bacterium]
ALDLVQAVSALGAEVGMPELRARAGVLTGEAAVTVGQEAEGMVVGDMVNTASRIQSAAEPGSVFVGDPTRRATDAAVSYEDAGTHDLKGKAEPMHLWRAARVVGGRAGALRSEGLEAPFVGRDRELRLVKDLLHSSADSRSAHLVSVIGIGGIGKSRLSWEFFKYIDGLQDTIYWHRGRCLSYGEGVTYWALAEMVRWRAGIAENEDQASAAEKLHASVEEHITDSEERQWVEPRLAHLLGLEDRTARDPEDLFSAWRVYFERMSETYPVALVFEDMQWADPSLLDFLDYLLTWSRSHRLFVMALARPEFLERHPRWGAGGRGVTQMHLEPLSPQDMTALLEGLVPGLPETVQAQILDRAQGVPLYAVETVRMLIDRGLLAQNESGSAYEPTGDIEDLEVPETLHALIAARLDGLPQEERRLAQDAAVLGKTFTVRAAAAVTGGTESDIAPLLSSLVRKEVLTVQADQRSPERGQYGFLQDLVRRVAYETLSKKERKLRHLKAAEYLEESWADDDEITEVVASHYLEAYQLAPDADDAADIKARARDALTQAAARAQSLAAAAKALEYFERAIDLTDDSATRAALLEQAGHMAQASAKPEQARRLYDAAIESFEALGRSHDAARVLSNLGQLALAIGTLDEAAQRMEAAYRVLSEEGPSEDLARLASEVGRARLFLGRPREAVEPIELALELSERFGMTDAFVWALINRAIILMTFNREHEAEALLGHAIKVSLEEDLRVHALRGYVNLSVLFDNQDRYEDERAAIEEGMELARKAGDLGWMLKLQSGLIAANYLLGRWDDAKAAAQDVRENQGVEDLINIAVELFQEVLVDAQRGEFDGARAFLDRFASLADSEDEQSRQSYLSTLAGVLVAEGKHAEALPVAEEILERGRAVGLISNVKDGTAYALEAAFELGEMDRVRAHISDIEAMARGEVRPYLLAEAARFRAKLAAEEGDQERADREFVQAEGFFHDMGMRFHLAKTQAEHGGCLTSQGQGEAAEPLLADAREIFTELGAKPWLERLDQIGAAAPEPAIAETPA